MLRLLLASCSLLGLASVGTPVLAQGISVTLAPGQQIGPIVGPCPQGGTFADGCQALLASGQLGVNPQFSSYIGFVTHAQQSGQTWQIGQLSQPQPWNIAGVNYAIGPSIARAALLNPIDNLPSGCTKDTSQIILGVQYDYVRCTLTQTYDIEGYDFHPQSGTDAGQCIVLRFQNATGITVKNNHIQDDTGCVGPTATFTGTIAGTALTFPSVTTGNVVVGQLVLGSGVTANTKIVSGAGLSWQVNNNQNVGPVSMNVSSGAFNNTVVISNSTSIPFTFQSNEVDGNCHNSTVQFANPGIDVSDARAGSSSTRTIQYNYFHGQCNRPGGSQDGSEVLQFNVFDDWCVNCSVTGLHGEVWETQTTTGTCTTSCTLVNVPSVVDDFNTIVLPAIASNGFTGPFFILGGRVGSSVTAGEVVGNTIIVNNFSAPITGFTYDNTSGVLTLSTGSTSLPVGEQIAVVNVTGTGSFAAAQGTFTTVTGTGVNAVAYNIGANLNPLTITGGNIQAVSASYAIMETSAQQFGTIKVAMNYVDTTGAIAGKCIVQGAGSSNGWTGNTVGNVLTITGSPTPANPGILVPGAVITGGTLVPPPTGTYPALAAFGGTCGGSSCTGFGLAGTYLLNSSPTNSVATSGNSYTPQSVVGTWTVPTDAPPHLGGTMNWNLLTNSAIKGFSDSNNDGAPSC